MKGLNGLLIATVICLGVGMFLTYFPPPGGDPKDAAGAFLMLGLIGLVAQ